MRLITTLVLAALASAVSALDTSLVQVQKTDGSRMVTIDGGTGSMRLYEVKAGRGDQAIELKASNNFLFDLTRLLKIRFPVKNPLGKEEALWSLARVGMGQRNQPDYAEMLNLFPRSVQASVFASEEAFHVEELAYDGKVQAAFATSYLMLVVPSTCTLLLYKTVDDELELVTWRNYRPELYVTVADRLPFESLPRFNDMKRQVLALRGGGNLLAERAADLAEVLEELAPEEDGDEAAPEASRPELLPVRASEPWVGALRNNRFVLIDPANNRLMTYFIPKKDTLALKSLRNIDLDRRLPSWPLPRRAIDEYDKQLVEAYVRNLQRARESDELVTWSKALATWVDEQQRADEPAFGHFKPREDDLTVALFRALARQDPAAALGLTKGGSEEPYDIVLDDQAPNLERLFFKVKAERRLLVYNMAGNGNVIELLSQRDHTIDDGIAVYNFRVRNRIEARKLMDRIANGASRQRVDWAMRNIDYLLSLSPELYSEVEQNRKLTRLLAKDERWQATLEKAMRAAEAAAEADQRLLETAQADLLRRDAALKRMAEGG